MHSTKQAFAVSKGAGEVAEEGDEERVAFPAVAVARAVVARQLHAESPIRHQNLDVPMECPGTSPAMKFGAESNSNELILALLTAVVVKCSTNGS
jgi:hypothetical protein